MDFGYKLDVLLKSVPGQIYQMSVSQTTIHWYHWDPIYLYRNPSGTERHTLKKACSQATIK